MERALQRFTLKELPMPPVGAHAVAAGDFVFLGGLLPTDYQTGTPNGAQSRSTILLVDDPARAQGEYIIRTADAILAHCGTSFDQVVRIDQFITDRAAAAPYLRARRAAFTLVRRPASSLLAVPALPAPSARISADIIAAAAGVEKSGIFTERAPVNFEGAPHGAQAGEFIFVQGQIASDFLMGIAVEAAPSPFWYETPVERETEYIIKKLSNILNAAGSSINDVVKANIYLTDFADFPEFERVWAKYFASNPPARTVIPVDSLGSPNCRIEINVIATQPGLKRTYVNVGGREPLIESDAVRAGDFLFLSGLLAGGFSSGLAPDVIIPTESRFFDSEIDRQVRFTLDRAKTICEAAGSSIENLCCSQIFLEDMADYYNFASAWVDILGEYQPVVTTIGVPDLAHCPGARVMIDLIAYAP